jgi:hypothetical protein
MVKIDLLNYFLVKESLVDMNFRENFIAARQGDKVDQTISDMYLARKLIYQGCKMTASIATLEEVLLDLEKNIPEIGLIFDQEEFQNAWKLTIIELRQKFNIEHLAGE